MQAWRALPFLCGLGAAQLIGREALAWTFPEHAQVTLEGLRVIRNDPVRARTLDEVWASARTILGLTRTCAPVDAPALQYSCIPLAALPALAGDHSCSPADLLSVITTEDWTLNVLEVAARAGARLQGASDDSRVSTRHGLNIDLQKYDALYAARAHVNGAHFQLTRASPAPDLAAYLSESVRKDQEPNATALFANFQASAIRWARRAVGVGPGAGLEPKAATQAWLEEAFALHFLEDSFAAGHVVGSWGDTSYRMGTHDFYCGFGIDAHTWGGIYYPAYGDAFLGDGDRVMTGAAVAASLARFLDVLAGDPAPDAEALSASGAVDSLDVCTTAKVPGGLEALASSPWIAEPVAGEPIPPTRSPSMPRSRSELGFFVGGSVGAAQATDMSVTVGDGFFAKASATFRAGYGFSAIAAPRMSNQIFGEFGVVGEQNPQGQDVGIAARVQVPWAYVPLDGLVALPVAAAEQGSKFWVGWAERAGRGFLGLQRTFFWRPDFSAQVSALTDFSIYAFPRQQRYEIAAPILSLYGALPLTWLVTTDGLLDLGVEEIFDPAFSAPHTAAFISLSSATKVFP